MDRLIQECDSLDMGHGLRLCDRFGVAYQADMTRSVPYDADYFAKHASYEGTAVSDAIQSARLKLVTASGCEWPLFDVGVGSGTFLKACRQVGRRVAGGFDVNPVAVEWLKSEGLFVDPAWWDEFESMAEPLGWTCWDVLEHLPRPHELLDRISVDEYLFVALPVFTDLRDVPQSKHFRPDEHYYYWTPAGLVRWLGEYGFELIEFNRDETTVGREGIGSFSFRRVNRGKKPLPEKRAFVVCGAESSGNRLLGAILCRAGCWGSGSTNQPDLTDIPSDEPLVMVIRHHELLQTYRSLRQRGYEVTAIMLVREWIANVGSLIERGHDRTRRAAEKRIQKTLLCNLFDATVYGIPLVVTTYESLTEAAISALLNQLGLRSDNLDQPLELRGQETPEQTYQPAPHIANAKHYQ